MGVKRVGLIMIIILISVCSYGYLYKSYNPSAIEIQLSSNVTMEDLNKIKESGNLGEVSLNYIKPYQNSTIIMSTGRDPLFFEIPVIQGQFIVESENKTAVIGDQIADRYFKSSDIIGKKINILNDQYRVMGILKDSKEIYIPFQEELIGEAWEKRTLRFFPFEKKVAGPTLEEVKEKLTSRGMEIISITVYEEKMYGYLNLVIFCILYVLANLIKKYYGSITLAIGPLWKTYKIQEREIEWWQYLKLHGSVVLTLLKELAICIVCIFTSWRALFYLRIPTKYIPENLFSPTSYKNTILYLWNEFLTNMTYGVGKIVSDTNLINLLILLMVILYLSTAKIKNLRCIGGSKIGRFKTKEFK